MNEHYTDLTREELELLLKYNIAMLEMTDDCDLQTTFLAKIIHIRSLLDTD